MSDIISKQFFSETLRAVYMSLEKKPCTVNEIISEVFKQKVSLWRPKKDVIRSLKILEIMGFVKRKLDGNRHIYEIIDTAPYHELDIYTASHCLQKMLEEFDNSPAIISTSDLKSAMKNFSGDEISATLELLEDKMQIKIKGDEIYKDTTSSIQKTSE